MKSLINRTTKRCSIFTSGFAATGYWECKGLFHSIYSNYIQMFQEDFDFQNDEIIYTCTNVSRRRTKLCEFLRQKLWICSNWLQLMYVAASQFIGKCSLTYDS